MNFENFVVVMIATSHSGNIGAAARAMKTMGFNRLRLVTPKEFPSEEASARASGATDVLDNAEVFDDFAASISDCHQVVGLSARVRRLASAPVHPKELAPDLLERIDEDQMVALVFGRERTGLTNEELELCHRLVHIPANPDYSSLNVASAIQVMLYELRATATQPLEKSVKKEHDLPATQEHIDQLMGHAEQSLTDIGFIDPENPKLLMRKLRLMFQRAELSVNEYNIFRGIFSAVDKQVKK